MKTSTPIIKTLLLVAVLLAVIAPISAEMVIEQYEHDTTFNGAFQYTRACACGTTTDYFTLENRGDFPATYRLTHESDVDWIIQHTYEVWLGPGESTVIPVTIAPPCDTEEATNYRVYATSEYGRFRVVDRVVTTHTCENIGFSVAPTWQSTLPCQDALWELTLSNTGTFDERYTLSADDSQVWFGKDTVRLAPGESATTFAGATWACDDYGERIVTFTADAERNNLALERRATVDVQWDYEFLVDVADEPADTCAEVTTERHISITNTGSVQNTYDLTTNGFATLAQETVTVQPGQTQRTTVFLDPTEDHVGLQSIPVSVRSELDGSMKTVLLEVGVNDCYENVIKIVPEQAVLCAGDENVSVQIQNRGLWEEGFALWTGGDIFSEVTPNEFSLRPGEHLNAVLHLVVPDRDDTFTVSVTALQTPGLESTATLDLQTVSNANCTVVNAESRDLEVYKDTGVVPIIIQNDGLEATTYELYWDGKIFTLAEESVFLAPGEQAVLHLQPNNLSAVDEGSFVERFLLVSHRSEYRLDVHVDLEEKGFFTRAYERVFGGESIDWCLFFMGVFILFILGALIVLLLTYIGALPQTTLSGSAKKVFAIVCIAVAVVLLIIAGVLAADVQGRVVYLDEPQGSDYAALYHEVRMNDETVIDLSEYFIDPDGDALNYTPSQPEHLTVWIEGDTAYIKPERNWAGVESVVFTAQDSSGLFTDSPIMTVKVLRTRATTFAEVVVRYCRVINLVLLAILFLIVALYAYTRTDKGLEKRYGQPLKALVVAQDDEMLPAVGVSQQPTRTGGAVVQGDAVAGDKIINVGKQSEEIFVMSTGGKSIHRPECVTARRIPKDKRNIIRGKDEALRAGYSPCRLCRPFDE